MGETEALTSGDERELDRRTSVTRAAATTARDRLADSAQAAHSHTIEEVTR